MDEEIRIRLNVHMPCFCASSVLAKKFSVEPQRFAHLHATKHSKMKTMYGTNGKSIFGCCL